MITCLPDTRRDILAQIRSWVDGGGDKHIYWLKGWAGTGKTTIALTVAREYSKRKRLGASFFFSRDGGDLASTRKFVATIAVQLAEVSPQLRSYILNATVATLRIHRLSLYDQWERLILQPLAQLSKEAFPHPLAIVIDALDECNNSDDALLLIRCFAAAAAVKQVDLRIFVTSRPDQPINVGFGDMSTNIYHTFVLHDIEQSIVNQDLAVYYNHQLGRMARTFVLDAAVLSDGLVEKLVEKSCGLFIYAATACRFVREGGPLAGERLARLISTERLPARAERELDRMYSTILEYSLSAQLDVEETVILQELFGRVVGSLAVLFDSLSPDSLAMMLAEPKGKIMSTLGSLHSVVEVPEQEGRLIRLLHPSFREYLLDPQRCSHTMFRIDAKTAHRQLLDCCLRVMADHLYRNMCDLMRPASRVSDIPQSDVDSKVPFAVQYACRYWFYHLEQGGVNPQEHPGIADFLEARFLFWVEALTLIGRLADGITMVRILETRLPVSRPYTWYVTYG